MEKIAELNEVKKELEGFLDNATFDRTKSVMLSEIKNVTRELENLNTILLKPKDIPRKTFTEITQFAFDESDNYVKLYIPMETSRLKDEDIELKVCDNKLSLTIQDGNKAFIFNVNSLLHPIDFAKSYKKIKSDMISVFLKKSKEGVTWKFLTTTEKQLKDKKEKMFEKEEGDDGGMGGGSADPNNALMSIMKKMYESGDPEMKRTIQKAWTEGQEKNKV